MAERFSCAVASRALQEPCYGTASQVRRWILVEQPGSWGADAVAQSGLEPDIAVRLRTSARAAGARLLLIRRHGRSAPESRTCYAVVSTPSVKRIERFTFSDPHELAEIDWAPLRGLDRVGGAAVGHPLYLVCTNGSHDACCAQFGRPVARALAEAVGDQVWESSHFGGDRFAGNLVCLPDGIYYGRVDAGQAADLVRTHAAGQVDLAHYRGRAGVPFVAQAAEHFVRVSRGLTRIDGVAPRQVEDAGEGTFRVAVETPDGSIVHATVACSDALDPQQLTCRAVTPEHPPRYRLVALD